MVASQRLGVLGDVSQQGLGCMGLSWAYSSALQGTNEEKEAFLRECLALGVTLYNSANIYAGPSGTNEELIGRAFASAPRESFVLTTKFGLELPSWRNAIAYDEVRGHCDAALTRTGFTYLDCFIVCRMSKEIPIEETMRALKELVQEGKIKAIGLSEASASQIRRAHAVHPLTLVEHEYSLFSRGIEESVLPTCRELGICVLAYSPVGRGLLTGAPTLHDDVKAAGPMGGADFRATSPRFSPEAVAANAKLVAALHAAAKDKGCTPSQLALAWVHAQGTDIFPIPGTTKIKHVKDNLGALGVAMTKAEADALAEKVSAAEVAGARYPAHGMAGTHEAMP